MNRLTNIVFSTSLALLVLIVSGRICHAEQLYVFYPSSVRTRVMQDKLNKVLPKIEIKVFGRYNDFKIKVKMDTPNAILTKEPVIEKVEGYVIKLKGSRKNSTLESYVLLSVGKKMNTSDITGVPIGVFDMLGRKEMKIFVAQYFKGSPPKLKRVSKMEDMLQLLTFNMAEAILISDTFIDYFKGISELNFVATSVPEMKIGIIALAVNKGKDARLTLEGFAGMDHKTKILLEVDNWK